MYSCIPLSHEFPNLDFLKQITADALSYYLPAIMWQSMVRSRRVRSSAKPTWTWRATVSFVCTTLTQLDTKMIELDSNIIQEPTGPVSTGATRKPRKAHSKWAWKDFDVRVQPACLLCQPSLSITIGVAQKPSWPSPNKGPLVPFSIWMHLTSYHQLPLFQKPNRASMVEPPNNRGGHQRGGLTSCPRLPSLVSAYLWTNWNLWLLVLWARTKDPFFRMRYKVLATIFVHHFSRLSFIYLQEPMKGDKMTLLAKRAFEPSSASAKASIYHADNGRFKSKRVIMSLLQFSLGDLTDWFC